MKNGTYSKFIQLILTIQTIGMLTASLAFAQPLNAKSLENTGAGLIDDINLGSINTQQNRPQFNLRWIQDQVDSQFDISKGKTSEVNWQTTLHSIAPTFRPTFEVGYLIVDEAVMKMIDSPKQNAKKRQLLKKCIDNCGSLHISPIAE
jgi:hypothetical protein